MAYNKAKEEKKWRLWKEAEEKQLRKLGVDESTIETLRTHDWAIFNSDRRYYQRMQEAGTYLEGVADDTQQPEIKTVEDFLDSIENQQLYQILIKVDKLTLQIALLKIQGYSTREIAHSLNITEKAVYRRMDRLKEKLKKFFESRGKSQFPTGYRVRGQNPHTLFSFVWRKQDCSLSIE